MPPNTAELYAANVLTFILANEVQQKQQDGHCGAACRW
jgi:hypothetical protein